MSVGFIEHARRVTDRMGFGGALGAAGQVPTEDRDQREVPGGRPDVPEGLPGHPTINGPPSVGPRGDAPLSDGPPVRRVQPNPSPRPAGWR